jgi:hypothetical protein
MDGSVKVFEVKKKILGFFLCNSGLFLSFSFFGFLFGFVYTLFGFQET